MEEMEGKEKHLKEVEKGINRKEKESKEEGSKVTKRGREESGRVRR